MGDIPLPALFAKPPEQQDVLGGLQRLLAIKSMLNQQQFQQQAQPLELQQQQQATQSGAVDLQMKQLALKNNQIGQAALSDPNFEKDFENWQGSKQSSGTNAAQPVANTAGLAGGTVQLHPVAQFLAEKKGLPLFGPGGAMEISSALTGNAQKMADLAKTQGQAGTAALDNHSKQLGNFDNLVEPILAEKDPAKQQQGVQNLQSEIQRIPIYILPKLRNTWTSSIIFRLYRSLRTPPRFTR